MSREELLTLMAVIIRTLGDNDKLVCSYETFQQLSSNLRIENRMLENNDVVLSLFED